MTAKKVDVLGELGAQIVAKTYVSVQRMAAVCLDVAREMKGRPYAEVEAEARRRLEAEGVLKAEV